MSKPIQETQHRECWLVDQAVFTPNYNGTLKSIQVPDAIELVEPNFKYEQVFNMKDESLVLYSLDYCQRLIIQLKKILDSSFIFYPLKQQKNFN